MSGDPKILTVNQIERVRALAVDADTFAFQTSMGEWTSLKIADFNRLLDSHEALRAALDAEARPSVWQDIATAPEVTYVLVWLPNYGLNVASATKGPRERRQWWLRDHGEYCYPTHWMPLPAPPEPTPSPTPPQEVP